MNELTSLPQHIAIIMDGNGRWAKHHGLTRAAGHQAGVKSIHKVINAAAQHGIQQLTLFGFSSENWRRPVREVKSLFALFYDTLYEFLPKLERENVRIQFIGCLTEFPKKLQNYLYHAESVTAKNTGLLIVVALNYGGRWDILQAVQKIVDEEVQQVRLALAPRDIPEGFQDASKRKLRKQRSLDIHEQRNERLQHAGSLKATGYNHFEISEETFSNYLTTSSFIAPDLLIRTSGEQRISNFLLWQLAYTELYFTQILWPDFDEVAFNQALEFYQSRQRRFGGLNETE